MSDGEFRCGAAAQPGSVPWAQALDLAAVDALQAPVLLGVA